jgi:thiosulfate reductase cytochrome b subunit
MGRHVAGHDAAFPLLEIPGGRQTARTIHFIAASERAVCRRASRHGADLRRLNNLRSMITGRYVIEPAKENS